MRFAPIRQTAGKLGKRSFDDFSHKAGEVSEQQRTKPSHPVLVEARPKEQVSLMPGGAKPQRAESNTSRSSVPRLISLLPARVRALQVPQGPFVGMPVDLVREIARQLDLQSFGRLRCVSTSIHSILASFTGGLLGQETIVDMERKLDFSKDMEEAKRRVHEMGRLVPSLWLDANEVEPELSALLLEENGWQELTVLADSCSSEQLLSILESLQCVNGVATRAKPEARRLGLSLSAEWRRLDLELIAKAAANIAKSGRLQLRHLEVDSHPSGVYKLLDPSISPQLESVKLHIHHAEGLLEQLGQALSERPVPLPSLHLINPGHSVDILRKTLANCVPRHVVLDNADPRWALMFIELGCSSLELLELVDFMYDEDDGLADALEGTLANTHSLESLTVNGDFPFAFPPAEEEFLRGLEKNTSLRTFRWTTTFDNNGLENRAEPLDCSALSARLLCAVLSHPTLQHGLIWLPEAFKHMALMLAYLKPQIEFHFFCPRNENCSAGLLALEAFRKKQLNDGSDDQWYDACFG